MEIVEQIANFLIQAIDKLGVFGPFLACLLISIESILPFLPLAAFITINFINFGYFFGFIISWIFTIIGCMISFYIFRKGFNKKFNKFIDDKEKLTNLMKKVDKVNFITLTLIIALPFTPAFLVNIAAGLSKISEKKFFFSLVIGKISLVLFWGFIGTNLLTSLGDPKVVAKILAMLAVTYIICKIASKKLQID